MAATKENHQRNFLERFCHKKNCGLWNKGSVNNPMMPIQTSPENFNKTEESCTSRTQELLGTRQLQVLN